jgi:hypothetical protein
MVKLALYEEYSRKDVHAIFSPATIFTPQTGTWGLQGVVPLSDRAGDYVFFVTIGKTQGEHTFDEGITEEGVLSWQSQPRQDLSDKWVNQWIHHNEFINNIYLFFRTDLNRSYAYLGRLKYLEHDRERERPVYFQWQILDWSLSAELSWGFAKAGAAIHDMAAPCLSPHTSRDSVYFADAHAGWAVGVKGTFVVTRQSGVCWEHGSSGTVEDLSSVHFVDANTGSAVSTRGTRDGGAHWEHQTAGPKRLLAAVHYY